MFTTSLLYEKGHNRIPFLSFTLKGINLPERDSLSQSNARCMKLCYELNTMSSLLKKA